MKGRWNIGLGLIFMAGFMLYGFFLVYLRDFAPGHEEWAGSYSTGKHFEARLAHVHGNLFALLNILVGWLLLQINLPARKETWLSILALSGMLMPAGILGEIYFGLSPVFVLAGALAMTIAILWLGLEYLRKKNIAHA